MYFPKTGKLIKGIKTFIDHEIAYSFRETQLVLKPRKDSKQNICSDLKGATRDEYSYKTSSLFLRECADYLTSIPEEVIHLVTGLEISPNSYVIDKMEKVKFKSSTAFAKIDINDSFLKLVRMDEEYGHPLLGVFHSHPFGGVAGTHPSGVDKNLQDVLESSGYRAIQAVFSRDGHIRFFSNRLKFKVEVYGKGIEKIENGGRDNEAIYRLVNFR